MINTFKKQLWIILLVIIGGNVYYYLNHKNDSDYYRGTVKIRTKAMAYDRLNTILSSYTSQNNQTNPQVKESYRSYRNEDNYIYEVYAESADSNAVAKSCPIIIDMVMNDSIIRMHYYQRISAINSLLQNQEEFLKLSDSLKSVGVNEELRYEIEFQSRQSELNIFTLNYQKINVYKDFEISPFNSESVVFIKEGGKSKLIKVNLILMVLGIFAAIVIHQFRNKNSE